MSVLEYEFWITFEIIEHVGYEIPPAILVELTIVIAIILTNNSQPVKAFVDRDDSARSSLDPFE